MSVYSYALIDRIDVNNDSDMQGLNVYDRAGEDANGVQRSQSYYADATDDLGFGKLSL